MKQERSVQVFLHLKTRENNSIQKAMDITVKAPNSEYIPHSLDCVPQNLLSPYFQSLMSLEQLEPTNQARSMQSLEIGTTII